MVVDHQRLVCSVGEYTVQTVPTGIKTRIPAGEPDSVTAPEFQGARGVIVGNSSVASRGQVANHQLCSTKAIGKISHLLAVRRENGLPFAVFMGGQATGGERVGWDHFPDRSTGGKGNV